jgi:hypothetical protein
MAFFIKKELTSDPFPDLKSALHCGQTPYINRSIATTLARKCDIQLHHALSVFLKTKP